MNYISNFNNLLNRYKINLNVISKASVLGVGLYRLYNYKKIDTLRDIVLAMGIEYIVQRQSRFSKINYLTNAMLLTKYPVSSCLRQINVLGSAFFVSGVAFGWGLVCGYYHYVKYKFRKWYNNNKEFVDYYLETNFQINKSLDLNTKINEFCYKILNEIINNMIEIKQAWHNLTTNQIITLKIGHFKLSSKYLIQNTPINVDKISPVYSRANPCTATHFTETTCQICFDTYDEQRQLYRVLPCGHSYHVNCIDEWFQLPSHNSCPTCRKTFNI
jgi:hypothetical protein